MAAWMRLLALWVLAPIGGVVVIGGVVFFVWLVGFAGPLGIPRDGDGLTRGPITEASVYASVRDVAGTHGGDGACAWAAARPPRFRCVVPGRGDGPLRCRVSVSRASGCWHAREAGFQPLHGCVPGRRVSGD